jgi:hypothetical protein
MTGKNEWKHGVCSCCDGGCGQFFQAMFCGPCMFANGFTEFQKGAAGGNKDASFACNLVMFFIPYVNACWIFCKRREYARAIVALFARGSCH